jgi:hypothetical protein
MWYQNMEQTVPVSEVQAGDIVLLNFNGKGTPDHCGLVIARGTYSGDLCVWTIEGNTTASGTINGAEDNGGMVDQKLRLRRNIVAVCRPQYKEEEIVDDITGHWAEKAIRRCIERGLLRGYPDGSFGPDKPVTRAELAVILDRLDKEDDLK